MSEEKFYSVPIAAELMGVSESAVYTWVREGSITYRRRGVERGIEIPQSAIDNRLRLRGADK